MKQSYLLNPLEQWPLPKGVCYGTPWKLGRTLIFASLAMLFAGASQCFAQETPTSSTEQKVAGPLDEFRAVDRAVMEKFAAFQKQLESDAQAGADKAQVLAGERAQMQFLGRFVEHGEFEQLDFFLDGTSKSDEFAAFPKLKSARAELRDAVNRRRATYKEKFPLALESLLANTVKACRDQNSAQEVAAVLARLSDYEEVQKQLPIEVAGREEILRYLHSFKTFAVAEAAGDPVVLGAATRELDFLHASTDALIQVKELEEYRTRTMKRLREQGAAELAQIMKALPTLGTAEAATPLIAKLEKLAATEEALTGRLDGKWDRSYSQTLFFLREWRTVLSFEADERWKEAAGAARRIQSSLSDGEPKLLDLAKERAEADANKERKAWDATVKSFTDKLSKRIATVTSPDDLQELADEVTPLFNGDNRYDSRVGWIRGFQSELQQIGSAWRVVEADSAFAVRALRERGQATHPWSKELAKLREKVMREAAASQASRPELLEPPLNQMPLADALQKLISDAAKNSDWERVYNLLQTQAVILQKPSSQQEIIAVKAYLEGVNFEKGELFADAVQSYRSVLRAVGVGRNVPTKEAAERLKAIKAQQPDLFKSPQ